MKLRWAYLHCWIWSQLFFLCWRIGCGWRKRFGDVSMSTPCAWKFNDWAKRQRELGGTLLPFFKYDHADDPRELAYWWTDFMERSLHTKVGREYDEYTVEKMERNWQEILKRRGAA